MNESAESEHRRYIEQRQDYARVASEHLTRFERSVLVASGGGLAAIFSLISNGKLIKSLPIELSVICFMASFGSMLVSHYFSYLDNERAIVDLDSRFGNQEEAGLARPWYSFWIEPLNWISVFAMAIGYALFSLSM